MQEGTNLWENLELLIETYDVMSGTNERWTVRLNSDLDLLIYKETNNTWFNKRTVRYREGDHQLKSISDLPDYFLHNLKTDFGSLLYVKSDSRVRYSGSKVLLKKLTGYLDAHDFHSSKLRIGKRKYKLFQGILSDTFFAKPSIAKAIKTDNCALEIQDREVKFSLIRHKENSYIWKIEKNGHAAFARVYGNAGLVSDLVSRTISTIEGDSDIRRFTNKYVLDEFQKEDFLQFIPGELIIEDEPFGPIIYKFSSTLFSFEKSIWRSKHLAEFNQIKDLESLIKGIKGIGNEMEFSMKRKNRNQDWEFSWIETGNVEVPSLNNSEDLVHIFLLDNAPDLAGFKLEIAIKDKASRKKFEKWVSSLNACYEIEVV